MESTATSDKKRSFSPKLSRVMAAFGIGLALLLGLGGILLFAFALFIPALIVLGAAILLGLIAGPALRKTLPANEGQMGRSVR